MKFSATLLCLCFLGTALGQVYPTGDGPSNSSVKGQVCTEPNLVIKKEAEKYLVNAGINLGETLLKVGHTLKFEFNPPRGGADFLGAVLFKTSSGEGIYVLTVEGDCSTSGAKLIWLKDKIETELDIAIASEAVLPLASVDAEINDDYVMLGHTINGNGPDYLGAVSFIYEKTDDVGIYLFYMNSSYKTNKAKLIWVE